MTAQQARTGFQSISAALNKVLEYDLMRLTKRSGPSFDNNAEGCYNQIVPPHALLCCQRMGFPKTCAAMLTKVLNSKIYKLKTGYGISSRHYMSNQLRRILGTGQGLGASPCIWILVLDTILWSVALKHSCFQITSPSGIHTHHVGDAFVDDISIYFLLPPHQDMLHHSPQDLADKIEIIAQDFERKIYSTGGNLSLPKCFWYLIDWVWEDNGTAK